jgi:hypothetical protein
MVRGFFEGFFTGVVDSRKEKNGEKLTPQLMKQLVVAHFEHINEYFFHVMFPLLIAINFDSYEQAVEDMQRRKFTNDTPKKMLLRYAAGSKPLFDHIVEEYKRQMYSLLEGRMQSVADHIRQSRLNITEVDAVDMLDADHSIRAVVRATMHAYALGIKAAATGKTSLHQPSVLRMMAEGMGALLHDEPFDVWADAETLGLDGVFRRATVDAANYETLINEMNQAYEDLAMGEGITSADDA